MATYWRDEPRAPDHGDAVAKNMAGEVNPPIDVEPERLLALVGEAERISREYHTETLERPIQGSLRAWRNEHNEGSKYLSQAFHGRTRLFVPKTRTSVRKNQATTAAALFSTNEVVSIKAEFADDDQARATAASLSANLNYRLNRNSKRSGMPWFLICMGGHLDGQITGVTISKQYWEFEEVETDETETQMVEVEDDLTGQITMEPQDVPKMRRTKDRPMIEIIPIENSGVDPAAPWHDPIQGGAWFHARYPMRLDEVRSMMKREDQAWLQDVPDELILQGRIDESRQAIRRVREGGVDRYEDAKTSSGDWDVVWIHENFMRIDGKDVHFWSVGRHGFLSEVRETHESYPAQGGERPYVMGVSQIDTHRTFPMSPVESWQPLQLELNDLTNLRLDTIKRNIAPLAKVRRGRDVDLTQLQRRGRPDGMLMLNSLDDVEFEQPPGPQGQAYQEQSLVNNSFDDLAGAFSQSSVSSNRQLNETVGGMQLLSGAANSVTEFDLRVWTTTWVERVILQVVHLIQHYEDDETVMAISGEQGQVMEKFGVLPGEDDYERTELLVEVAAGIGATDPMQRIVKLREVFGILEPMMGAFQAQGIDLDAEAIIEELMGAGGYKDGKRFFKFGEPPEQQPDPRMQVEQVKAQTTLQKTEADNQTKIQIEQMRGHRDMTMKGVDLEISREDRAAAARESAVDRMQGQMGLPPQNQTKEIAEGNPMESVLMGRMEEITRQVQALGGVVRQISQRMDAPAEIVRGRDGRAVGVRKNGAFQQIVRDGEGRAAGAVPIGGPDGGI